MRMIERWSIGVRKEFKSGTEDLSKTRWVLYKDEDTAVAEMTITELRDLKKFFDGMKDPFASGNPDHVQNLK